MKHLSFLLLVMLLSVCKGKSQIGLDTVIYLSDDPILYARFTINEAGRRASHNASVHFYKKINQNDSEELFVDALYCMSDEILFKDFNNDGLKDLLIFHSTGGRANPTYYLYLLDQNKHSVMRVSGFENLPNPDIDKGIITSIALAGTHYIYSFYMIENNKLTDMHTSFETDRNDTTQYFEIINKLAVSRH